MNVSKSCNTSSSAEKSINGSASPGWIVAKSSSNIILYGLLNHDNDKGILARVIVSINSTAPPADCIVAFAVWH